MSDQKQVKFADQIWVKIDSHEEFIGSQTTVSTLEFMAAVSKLSSYEAIMAAKPGDQIEWTITLSGRTTIEPRMIAAAREQLLR